MYNKNYTCIKKDIRIWKWKGVNLQFRSVAKYFLYDYTGSPEELFNLKIEQISGGVNITWNDISSEVVTYLVEITQGKYNC